MRRAVAFAALGLPPVLWPAAHLWAEPRVQAWSAGWVPGAPDLSTIVRLAYSFDLWTIRMLPFVMIPIWLAQPLIIWAIAKRAGAASAASGAKPRDVLSWWSVSLVPSVALLIITLVWDARLPLQVLFFAMWVSLVAFWIAIATAYGVQLRRRREHREAWHPRWLLGLGWLGGFGWLMLPVMGLLTSRRDSVAKAG
jgi:hypothetical protein